MLRRKAILEIHLTMEIWIPVGCVEYPGVAWIQKMVNPHEMMDLYALLCNQVHQRLEHFPNKMKQI